MGSKTEYAKLLSVVFFVMLLLTSFSDSNISNEIERTSHEDIPTLAADPMVIVIDYSHGQDLSPTVTLDDDIVLGSELESMGYSIIWAKGGLNSSVLTSADGLLMSSILSVEDAYHPSEITAISEWFDLGSKLLWVGCDNDFSYTGPGKFINDNMTAILESVGSHVYPEPTAVEDPESNAFAPYRVIANQTTDDPQFSDIVAGVETVLFHGPTLLYGSDNETSPGAGIRPVALENTTIENVYPLLYYSNAARIYDNDLTLPIAHDVADVGAFVTTTIELNAGSSETGVIIVSGSSPYGIYRSMHLDDYVGFWNGSLFVKQAIDFGLQYETLSVADVPDIIYEEGIIGNGISWHPISTSPEFYNITLDGTLIGDGLWNLTTEVISIMIDGHSVGSYNYTLTVKSKINATASDSVIVIVEPAVAPVITHPTNITYTEGETGNVIAWEISDTSLKNYTVYRNGIPLNISDDLTNDEPLAFIVEQSVDGYSPGMYDLTIVVIDRLNLVSIDTVWVEVLTEITTTTTNTTTTITTTTSTSTTTSTTNTTTGFSPGDISSIITLTISIGSIIVIVVVVVLIFRGKK